MGGSYVNNVKRPVKDHVYSVKRLRCGERAFVERMVDCQLDREAQKAERVVPCQRQFMGMKRAQQGLSGPKGLKHFTP